MGLCVFACVDSDPLENLPHRHDSVSSCKSLFLVIKQPSLMHFFITLSNDAR